MRSRKATWFKHVGLACLLVVILTTGCTHYYIQHRIVDMPGESYAGTPPVASETTKEIAGRLRKHVEVLSNEIGGRSIYNNTNLERTKTWIATQFRKLDLEPNVQTYEVKTSLVIEAIDRRNEMLKDKGEIHFLPAYGGNQPTQEVANLWVEFEGRTFPDKLIVVGAHYDTVTPDCPGADDNSTGVAGLLEIARQLKKRPPKFSVILAAFTCEEYPVGGTKKMGSAVFAEWLLTQEKRRPAGAIALDMLGYYSAEPGSQGYPPPFSQYYPDTADFICFVGDATSRKFIRSVVGQFRQIPVPIPSEGVAAPVRMVPDVLRSDHEHFVRNRIPGLMVTDTANFRYKNHYHKPTDTLEKLDFIKFAHVVEGLSQVIREFED